MLLIDTRKNIPLNPLCMDWNPDHVQFTGTLTARIPIYDESIHQAAEGFAYEIASHYAWLWPDLDKTTVALQADLSCSFPRYWLVVGTKPSTEPDTETDEEWSKFEMARQEAIRENHGNTVYDAFPVMLTLAEDGALREMLFDRLNMY